MCCARFVERLIAISLRTSSSPARSAISTTSMPNVSIRRRPQLDGLFRRPALKQSWAFFVHPDELHQVFDTDVGEGLDAIFADAIDPDDAVFDLHFIGDVSQPIFVFAKVLG